MLTIWHNPRCTKSRQTLALLEGSGKEVDVRLYLKDTPSEYDIKDMMDLLGLDNPRGFMRKGEAIYKSEGLKDVANSKKLIEMMAKFPILIERPIVTDGRRAIIGRPPEAVKPLL
jgi:arsenate reductase